jgi:hypothetical protein
MPMLLSWVITLAPVTAVQVQQCPVQIPAGHQVAPIDGPDVNILGHNVGTSIRARTHKVSNNRRKHTVGSAPNVAESDIGDLELRLQAIVSTQYI